MIQDTWFCFVHTASKRSTRFGHWTVFISRNLCKSVIAHLVGHVYNTLNLQCAILVSRVREYLSDKPRIRIKIFKKQCLQASYPIKRLQSKSWWSQSRGVQLNKCYLFISARFIICLSSVSIFNCWKKSSQALSLSLSLSSSPSLYPSLFLSSLLYISCLSIPFSSLSIYSIYLTPLSLSLLNLSPSLISTLLRWLALKNVKYPLQSCAINALKLFDLLSIFSVEDFCK